MSTDPKSWGEGKEVQSSWFKFKKVGDGIKGTLTGRRYQEATTPGFPNQYIYELKDAEGNAWNVGISEKKSGTVQRLNSVKLGEVIGILFEKEIPATSKGFNPAKALKVLTFGMDESYEAMEAATATPAADEDIPFID